MEIYCAATGSDEAAIKRQPEIQGALRIPRRLDNILTCPEPLRGGKSYGDKMEKGPACEGLGSGI